jgi:hypothetical protein
MGKCTPIAKMRPYINKLELRQSLKTPISKAKYMILEEKVLSKEMQNIQNLLQANIKDQIEKSRPVDMFKTTKMMFAPQFLGDEKLGKKNEYGFDEAQLEEMEQQDELSVEYWDEQVALDRNQKLEEELDGKADGGVPILHQVKNDPIAGIDKLNLTNYWKVVYKEKFETEIKLKNEIDDKLRLQSDLDDKIEVIEQNNA